MLKGQSLSSWVFLTGPLFCSYVGIITLVQMSMAVRRLKLFDDQSIRDVFSMKPQHAKPTDAV